MRKLLQVILLPALILLITLPSCKKEFSSDQPFPPKIEPSVFVGNNNKMVYSLDVQSGKINWKLAVDGEVHASPVMINHNLYVGTTSGTLYKVSYRTGTVDQERSFSGDIEGTPLPYKGNLLVAAGNTLYYIDAGSLEDIWAYDAGGVVACSPTAHTIPDTVDSAIFIATINNKVIALKPDGSMFWEKSPSGGTGFHSSPCVTNDKYLYIGNDNGTLYALNILNGNVKWAFSTGGKILSSPIRVNGNILVGSNDRYLYSVDSGSGGLRWKFESSDQIVSSPAVSHQNVYFGSYDGYIYCIDIIDGHLKWKTQTFGLINASPTIIDNALYIGSYDKNLYKLDVLTGDQIWVRDIRGQIQSSVLVDTIGGTAVSSISGLYKY